MRVLALLVIAGCGRLAFDARTDAARDTSPDAPCSWSAFSAPVKLGGPLNSSSDDWVPAPARDGLDLYFYSYRTGAQGTGIWHAERPTLDVDFAAATLVGALDTASDERTVGVSDDGLAMVFERSPRTLFATARGALTDPFGAATELTMLDTAANGDPCLSADGLRLVFVSSRPGTGGDDLWEATRATRASPFGAPVELAVLNSPQNEYGPGLSADGLEVFFASVRPGGAGGFDIYTSTRPALDQPFALPHPVSEVNSALDDVGPRLSSDGTTLYFNYSTLTGGGSNADFWMATRQCL